MVTVEDTIVAVATPPGHGGIGVVRIAGSLVPEIARRLTGQLPRPRYALFTEFSDSEGGVIDNGIVLYFPAPHSFTGDDVLELQAHGGPIILDMLVAQALACGARHARPGEFTERAFLNDKIDLLQAEAVADLIDSASQEAARSALRSLQGDFSARINRVSERISALRVYIEAAMDFPEEEVDFLAEGEVSEKLDQISRDLTDIRQLARQGSLLRDGMKVVISGRPNAGKSSLLNCLARRNTAIVTAIPGTTRDVLRERVNLDGMPLHIIDTAGLRDSRDCIEAEGIKRAWLEIEHADCMLLVIDDCLGMTQDDEDILARLPARLPRTIVRNKIDISLRAPGVCHGRWGQEVAVSAMTGLGIPALCQHLKSQMGFRPAGEGDFSARRRHIDALERTIEVLKNARYQFEHHHASELLAEELRLIHRILGEITGVFTTDELLRRIFADFCIGK